VLHSKRRTSGDAGATGAPQHGPILAVPCWGLSTSETGSVQLSEHIGYDVVRRDSLTPFPGNPRRGALEHIKRSLARFGQYRTVVVWPTGGEHVIVAGNHTTLALDELSKLDVVEYERLFGESAVPVGETIRVEYTDFDGWDEARRVNAADNRLAELGTYDDDALRVLLSTFGDDFDGTGWAREDLKQLLAEFEPTGDVPPRLDMLEPRLCPKCGYDVANDPEDLST